jgi:hypothetical protein
MAHWAVVFPAERLAEERLFANDSVPLDSDGPTPGDVVLLIAGSELFGIGRIRTAGEVHYTHRLLDEPLPVGDLKLDGPGAGASGGERQQLSPGVYPLEPSVFEASAGAVDPYLRTDGPKRTWLVSIDLPIEAASPAEAARLFWSYVYELGPQELPAFVSPTGNELAMQAFVLGVEANQDPEEDD